MGDTGTRIDVWKVTKQCYKGKKAENRDKNLKIQGFGGAESDFEWRWGNLKGDGMV